MAIKKVQIVPPGYTDILHPETSASVVIEETNKRFMTDAEKTKLAGISTGANNYSHPTSSGNKHIPTGGSSGQFLKYSSNGTATWAVVPLTDTSNLMPISGGVLENYREKLVSLSGTTTAINLNNGNIFTHTLSGNTTYSITNAVSGQAHSFTLIITQTATVRTITFPASVVWAGGEIPDLTVAIKTYILTFLSVDGGTTWRGMLGGEF